MLPLKIHILYKLLQPAVAQGDWRSEWPRVWWYWAARKCRSLRKAAPAARCCPVVGIFFIINQINKKKNLPLPSLKNEGRNAFSQDSLQTFRWTSRQCPSLVVACQWSPEVKKGEKKKRTAFSASHTHTVQMIKTKNQIKRKSRDEGRNKQYGYSTQRFSNTIHLPTLPWQLAWRCWPAHQGPAQPFRSRPRHSAAQTPGAGWRASPPRPGVMDEMEREKGRGRGFKRSCQHLNKTSFFYLLEQFGLFSNRVCVCVHKSSCCEF